MAHQHNGISVEVMEIALAEDMNGGMINGQDIDHLIAIITAPAQTIQPPLLPQQQAMHHAPVIQRSIPDQLYIPGGIWLGECAVCRDHDNEGFLITYENSIATCAHPLCQGCADRILATTRTCPKCRRLARRFLPVRLP